MSLSVLSSFAQVSNVSCIATQHLKKGNPKPTNEKEFSLERLRFGFFFKEKELPQSIFRTITGTDPAKNSRRSTLGNRFTRTRTARIKHPTTLKIRTFENQTANETKNPNFPKIKRQTRQKIQTFEHQTPDETKNSNFSKIKRPTFFSN